MAAQKKPILLLVDGNSLVHRGFHAIPHLSTKSGEPTNGVYGFALLFLKALKELAPTYVAVAFDLPEPTFRDKLYEPYKAKRIKAPDELYSQIPRVKELVKAFSLPIYEMSGYEADDLIGSLATLANKEKDLEVIILTGDLDTLQLVDERVKVYAPKQGLTETKLYDQAAIRERYGLEVPQLVDYRALRGDPSDNIPGVKGIGEKTAAGLLQEYKTLEGVYKNLDKVKPRVGKLLEEYKPDAEISQKLSQIVCDLKLELDLDKSRLGDYDEAKVVKLLQTLEFGSLLDKLPQTSLELSVGSSEQEGLKKRYVLVAGPEEYEKFIAELQKQKSFAIDTETTSLNPLQAELLGIGFCWRKEAAHYLPKDQIGPEVRSQLESPKIAKTGHNIKYDFLVLKRAGIELAGISFDTMIAAYLLNPGSRNFDLDTLAFNEFGFRKTKIENLIGTGRDQINMADVPLAKVSAYCCEDVDYTWRLAEKLEPQLRKMNLLKIFEEIETPLIKVLAEMENLGIKIEPNVLKQLSKEAASEIGKLEKKIWRLAGEEFNIGSPVQLKQILFEKLGIPTEELKKGKAGLFSTAATELEKLRGLHPIIDLLFEWRELSKLKSTYFDALPVLINPETRRLHTSFNQTIAATGRLSSSEPNLQNIPIRTPLGRKIRRAFAADQGYKLVSIDYSQIELRIAAHLSGDAKMIKVFNGGGDIHEATARELFGVGESETPTPEMRRLAKTVNFAVLYGASAYGISSRIQGVSRVQAQEFIDKYFKVYANLARYLEQIIEETRKTSYVRNEIGRIRLLPEINSSQFQVRSAAERAAINMPLQSLAADIIKMAMNKLAEKDLATHQDCKLLLQVHDELLFEMAENMVEQYAGKIVEIMENVYKLKVPLVASAKAGTNWLEITKLNF